MLDALIDAGVDIFRLNFSHGTHETHGATMRGSARPSARQPRWSPSSRISAARRFARAGSKAAQPIPLAKGDRLRDRTGDVVGRPGELSTTYAPLAHERASPATSSSSTTAASTSESRIGRRHRDPDHSSCTAASLASTRASTRQAWRCRPLRAHAKDEEDLRFGIRAGVDMIALSVCAARLGRDRGSRAMLIGAGERPRRRLSRSSSGRRPSSTSTDPRRGRTA